MGRDGADGDGVASCFAAAVAELHRVEVSAARVGEWVGVANRAFSSSHVDRILAFLEEERLLCEHCGGALPKVAWNARHVLDFPDVASDQRDGAKP